jgi:hypothetical protein
LQRFQLNIFTISHQQAIAEHWDLPNTEIFQSKDVASGIIPCTVLADSIVASKLCFRVVYCYKKLRRSCSKIGLAN